MRLSRLAAAASVFAGLVPFAWPWYDTGHMVVAAIAQDQLTPKARSLADHLLTVGATEKAYDFVTAAPWADDLKSKESAPWHYYDIYFRADGKATNLKADPENALTAIDHFSRVLADRTAPEAQRADALRFIIHIVGDVHQPLHAVSRVTSLLPNGDRGGNDFHILPPDEFASMERPPRNLHSLWDFGAGLFPSIPRPLSKQGEDRVRTEAWLLESALPPSSLRESQDLNPRHWVDESYKIAKSAVYALPENQAPSDGYLREARRVVAKRITLAGYRLAGLLNKLLG